MSYLDQPRINFSGKFQASPATVNNTPNNYNPANYNEDSLKPENIELYWEPKGDSIFDLISCKVTNVQAPGVTTDSLVGSTVTALYTGAPPKLVDLDPMQQNGSEVWGLTVMLGDFSGAWVQGVFSPVSFNGIWGNSQGPNTPRNSASGSAVYQSTLTNLKWNVGNSAVLQALQARSPNRLSIRMVVSAHNNAPQLYAFTSATFQTMLAQGVPQSVLNQLVSLQGYVMNVDANGNPVAPGRGYIPTQAYVSALLQQLLGQSTADQYSPVILGVAKQPYAPWINYSTKEPLPEQPLYDFNYGKIVGSVGPCLDDEPTYAVPARTLAPPANATTPAAWWAQATLDLQSSTPSLSLDLANSLPVRLPGRPLWTDMLGTLSLAYYTGTGSNKTYTTIVPSIDYSNPDFIDKQSGMLVITNFGSVDPKSLANLPLALRSTTPANGTQTLLEENSQGLSMRANKFIFRMNPGLQTTPSFPLGETNTVDIYVRKFGRVEGTEALKVSLAILDPAAAATYTLGTLGTSGTNGINAGNISTPPGKLQLSSNLVPVTGGKASLTITGNDPGNPRQFVDGQVYFATYTFSPSVADYNQDPNDLVSAQIYQQNPISGTPTWVNGIGDILRQYGMLYPIMGRFQLWTYEGVVENREKIQRVLSMDISQPLHMPVSRDLSTIRCNLILNWFSAGMPYGPIGPVGGPGTSWNNLPTVSGWGPMTSLLVRSGDIIDAIQPSYGANTAPFEGGPGGNPHTIDLTNDAIVSLTGFTGTYFGLAQVAQITFHTASGKTYGPFGSMQNVYNPQPFTLAAPTGSAIRSFFGTTVVHSGGTTYIASIGGNVQLP
jgi:jacalin-like lectin domain-containing protein